MITREVQQRVADAGVAAGWFGWFVSHIEQINGVAQFVLLITSIAATLVAMLYHWKKIKKL